MISTVCVVSYHELGLKGKNRSKFERRLMNNIDFVLKSKKVAPAIRLSGRILVEVPEKCEADELARMIADIAGVAHVMISYRIGRSLQEIENVALRVIREAGAFNTFRVTAKRSNTDFTMTSLELNEVVGAFLVEHTGAKVKLKNPDVNVSIIIVGGDTLISARRIEGIGGLPSGSSGKVVSLLSSGIDSPVATWRILRRGAIGVGVHFSGRPATSSESELLVKDIGEVLSKTSGMGRIYVIPFGDIQKEIASIVLPDLRIIMYRRVMIKVAEAIASYEGATALVTGESLGQVASQTLENIVVVDEAATLPILRPLIGNDKNEIILDARRIGTFEISSQNAADCCTLFMPRKPETHARIEAVLKNWAELDIDSFVERCMQHKEYIDFSCREYQPPHS
ncbi:MAG: tRNA 4-thiouridine(8) synthase ThiI [Coriobacteriia bacterium]|nr:tRNA 4-thiouridine(8) synthase ThiI [Coriobacteriia bacterium]